MSEADAGHAPVTLAVGAPPLLQAGRLLHDFNTEFDDGTPGAEALAARLHDLVAAGDTEVLLVGRAEGVAVLRFRRAARHLYAAEGFRRTEGDGGPLTFHYEREL
jgi:hypothetical protein